VSAERTVRVSVPVSTLDAAQERHVDVPRLMRDALIAHIEATRVMGTTTTISDDDEDGAPFATISWSVR
jgi:hypothetical protein